MHKKARKIIDACTQFASEETERLSVVKQEKGKKSIVFSQGDIVASLTESEDGSIDFENVAVVSNGVVHKLNSTGILSVTDSDNESLIGSSSKQFEPFLAIIQQAFISEGLL